MNNVRSKKRSAFRSSGGISVLIKETLIQTNFIKRIFDDFNECIVLLLDGQKFVNQNDIIIVFAYVAPERSTFYTDPATNGIELLADKILSIISEYPNADLLLAGDFNARTKDYMDFIVEDEADYIFGQNTAYPADEFYIPRKNKDIDFSNTYGISLIELCCTFNIHILNGRLFGDKDGNFTCFANNGTSVVDYMIASTALFSKFTYFAVDDFDISDHLPVYCTLTLHERPKVVTFDDSQATETNVWEKYRWNPKMKDAFMAKFRDNFLMFQENFGNEEITLVSLLSDFINVFKKSAETMKCRTRHNNTFKHVCQPDWWDTECEQAKQEIGCKQGFQYTPRNVELLEYSYVQNPVNLSYCFQDQISSCLSSICL